MRPSGTRRADRTRIDRGSLLSRGATLVGDSALGTHLMAGGVSMPSWSSRGPKRTRGAYTSPGFRRSTRSSSSAVSPRPRRRRLSSSAPSMSAWRRRSLRRRRLSAVGCLGNFTRAQPTVPPDPSRLAPDRRQAVPAAPSLQDPRVARQEPLTTRRDLFGLDGRLDEPARLRGHEREAVETLAEDVPGPAQTDVRHRAEHRDLGTGGHEAMVWPSLAACGRTSPVGPDGLVAGHGIVGPGPEPGRW